MDKNKDSVILKCFILPLYGLSAPKLEGDYLNSYINREGSYLFLELKEPKLHIDNVLYSGISLLEDRKFYLFSTPYIYKKDILLIIDGRYSEICKKAKNVIIQLCGLPYMIKDRVTNRTVTAAPLMALIKHKQYKEMLESKLNVVLGDSELIDRLSDKAFIESIINQEL